MKDTNSLSHTSYRCKYHIVIIPKYRRMVIYNKLRKEIWQILRMQTERSLIYLNSEFMVKSKSALMMFEWQANMKYKFGNRKF